MRRASSSISGAADLRPRPLFSVIRLLVLSAVVAGLSACAPRRFEPPSGPGIPIDDYADRLAAAAARCRSVRTYTAELSMSGRAGDARIRGRALTGLAPGAVRLEGLAPFGAPTFILAADASHSVLLLPRDDRVLVGEPPGAVLEALTGVPLSPDELRAVATGCGSTELDPVGGRSYDGDWTAIELRDGTTLYLRGEGTAARVGAAETGRFIVEYVEYNGSFPSEVRLRSSRGSPEVTLRVGLSQIEANVPLGPEVFSVVVPETAVPLTLEELREAGPLGQEPR